MEKYWTLSHNLSNGHAPSASKSSRGESWITEHGLLNKEPDSIASINDLFKNHHLSMYRNLADPEDMGIKDPDSGYERSAYATGGNVETVSTNPSWNQGAPSNSAPATLARGGRVRSDPFSCGSKKLHNDEYAEWDGHSAKMSR